MCFSQRCWTYGLNSAEFQRRKGEYNTLNQSPPERVNVLEVVLHSEVVVLGFVVRLLVQFITYNKAHVVVATIGYVG